MIVDKRNILSNADISALNLTLELGCGQKKRFSDSVGVDQLDFDSVDIVGDAIEVLSRLPDQSIRCIVSSHFFEHIEDLKCLVTECSRVLVTGGTLDIVVPHFSNPYFYSDYTHKRFFGLYTFSYLCDTPCFRRLVPRYGNDIPLTLTDVYLNFRGEKPFYIRHVFGRIFSTFINSSNYLKEFYEVNLCYFVHCHEIKFVLKKKPVFEALS